MPPPVVPVLPRITRRFFWPTPSSRLATAEIDNAPRSLPEKRMSEARRRRGGQSGIVRLDPVGAAPIFTPMSEMRDPRRLSRADLSFRPFEPCLPRPAKEPPAGAG